MKHWQKRMDMGAGFAGFYRIDGVHFLKDREKIVCTLEKGTINEGEDEET